LVLFKTNKAMTITIMTRTAITIKGYFFNIFKHQLIIIIWN
jgi:hypothetical protein